ncbi:hypothetical protein CLV56_1969 [Mumia flava]|uniref:YHS domain-containing protein n=1 Tax=Mumia flava TaxID=1348852 RepID=A0A0B2B229_9ACTN|nr:hypothetical protein [Mumia flava]PJJ57731.1 hypothetical protein CLV56_1969 [Mumia flava]
MILIDIRCPADGLDSTDRTALADDVVAGLVGDQMSEDVPDETLARARAMTHVVFGSVEGWTTGHGRWHSDSQSTDSQGTAAPLWITVTVPETWRDEIAPSLIGWVRRAVRHLDERQGRERSVGDLWINVTGIVDGSIGLDGRPATADDVVAVMSEPFHARRDTDDVDLPEGTVIDPMCGMRVRLGPRAITLESDGATLGFCARSCRDAYVRREDAMSAGGSTVAP